MAAAVKFQDFVEQLGLAKHQLNTDTQKIVLTNTAPNATDTTLSAITQISSGNGYTTGGEDIQNTWAESGGTGTLTGTKVTWTAGPSSMAAFRYVVLYNDTQTSPADPLMLYWDYGSSLTLAAGETFDWRPNNSTTTGTVLTIA